MKNLFLCSAFVFTADKFPFQNGKEKRGSVAFVPTAGNLKTDKPWMEADRQKLRDIGFDVEDLEIEAKDEQELTKSLENKDIVFVGGGNTFYLLYHSKKSGFDKVVKNFVEKGKWYIGSSAGAVIAGPSLEPIKYFDEPEVVPDLKDYKSFGFIDSVILPHYGSEKYGDLFERAIAENKARYDLITLTDQQALLVQDGNITKI